MTTLTTQPLPFGAEEATFIRRSLLHSLRDGESMVMAIMLPVITMLMFTFVFGGAIDSSGDYVNYVVPGIVLLCAGFGASSTAVSVAQDMQNGIVDRFRTMPIRASAVLTGHVVASLVRNLLATALVIGVGIAVGFRPQGSLLGWLGALALVALYILAITYLFAAIGLAAGSAEAAASYGFILLFLPYVSSAFVPIQTMPDWMHWIASNQPLTPIIETIRGLLMGTELGNEPLWALGWCVAILAVSIVFGAVMFQRKAGRR
ncbi:MULTISPECIES: ABC transporter permease [unclassified Cryobacterium]|uniref:ABC transporter permease n=1 Tax=unclassified Cryobacterium TaxID=2649013 RepID=UPI001444D7FE|nr:MULTISPECIES: ABC transporter permease [unclassified Cryobacterium]